MLADRLSAVLPRLEPGPALLARMLALTLGNLRVTGRGGYVRWPDIAAAAGARGWGSCTLTGGR
jgi:hypothetical protein